MIRKAKGAILFPKGFVGAACHSGLKSKRTNPDLAILASTSRASFAAVFTKNRISAAPVKLSKKIEDGGLARAIVVNAGNANACTSRKGMNDARRMAQSVAKGMGINVNEVAVASTGIIGKPLPMAKIVRGIKENLKNLSSDRKAAHEIAQAIMTTDTFPKEIIAETRISGKKVRIGGIAKGAGMICPNMATLLSFMTTDAAISARLLKKALVRAAGASFNRLTVDGHMSTNDSVMILANGASGAKRISVNELGYRKFETALAEVCKELAKLVARDGEGATKFIEIKVNSARTEKDARDVAFAVANSALVKTALHGEDPNWGRIASAAGYAADVVEEKMVIAINGVKLFNKGTPASEIQRRKCARALRKRDISIAIDLGLGAESQTVWTCDLTRDYIKINADYHT